LVLGVEEVEVEVEVAAEVHLQLVVVREVPHQLL
jgi:hypothetical protein